jgi:hypothetical protein
MTPSAGKGGHASSAINDPDNQRAAIGVRGDFPFVLFSAPDGKSRMTLALSIFSKPYLVMADETGKRLSLGLEHSDTPSARDDTWALDFAPNMARIAMASEVQSGRRYIRGSFSVSRGKILYPYDQSK